MTISIALIIFSSIALVTCMFMVTYFLFIKKEHKLIDLSLGLLFFAIALRISKSIFYYVFLEISTEGVGLGFLGFASIGPLLYFYFKLSQNNNYKLRLKDSMHFIFALTGFIVITFFDTFHNNFYLGAKLQLAIYLIYIGRYYIYIKNDVKAGPWHNVLFYAMIALLGVLTYQYFTATLEGYTYGTALASLIIYALFFIALKSPSVIKKTTTTDLPQDLLNKISIALEVDKIYVQPSITLAQFSEAIETPTYLVSKATKAIYKKNFPEIINSFRIKEIQKKLSLSEHVNDKVEDLAYDVGFNTSSAFYNAFKKETSMSPRAYQKMIHQKDFQSTMI